jgi:hypothetical protein
MAWFAVFITDPDFELGPFVGVARRNVEAADEDDARDQAIELHSSETGGTFTREAASFCARLRDEQARTSVRHPSLKSRRA